LYGFDSFFRVHNYTTPQPAAMVCPHADDGYPLIRLYFRHNTSDLACTNIQSDNDFLLLHRHKSDALERFRIDESFLAKVLPFPDRQAVLAILTARPPWSQGILPVDWVSRSRLIAASQDRRTLRFQIRLPHQKGSFILELEGSLLRRLEWRHGKQTRLRLRYEKYTTLQGVSVPRKMTLEAPQEHVKAEVTFDTLTPRVSWEESDFEVF